MRGVRDAYEEVFSPVNSVHHQQHEQQQHVDSNNTLLLDDQSRSGFENGANHNSSSGLAPLEVGSPSRLSNKNPADESFSQDDTSSSEDHMVSNQQRGSYFFNDSNNAAMRSSLLPHNHSSNNINQLHNTQNNNKQSVLSPKQTSWLLYLSGMIGMSILNPVCCVLAMKYANPSILAPFSGLTLVWVVLFSGYVVNEHPGKSQKVACALIVCGEVMVAMWGDHTNGSDKSVDDVVRYVFYNCFAFLFHVAGILLYISITC